MAARLLRLAAALWAAAALGCVNLGKGTPESVRLYLLAPVAEPAAGAPCAARVEVGPVALAGYLNRSQLVSREGPHEVRLAEFARWAEPLEEQLPRVLAEDLARLLGSDGVRAYPCGPGEAPAYRALVAVERLEVEGAKAVFAARWSLAPRAAGRPLREGRTSVAEPLAEPGYAGVVAAQSRALATLAREVAEAVREAEGR